MSEPKKDTILEEEEFEFPLEQANAATNGMRVNILMAIIK